MQQHKRRRKGGLIHYPVLILFSVFFVGMFLLDCVTPDRTVSELENTTLTQRPKVTAQILSSAGLNRFFDDYTQYTKDQIPGRDAWISLQSFVETALLQKTQSGGILLGDKGQMFDRTYGLVSSEERTLPRNIAAVASLAARCPGKVYVMVAPAASSIYPERVPAHAPLLQEESYLGQIQAAVEQAGGVYLPLEDALSAHKDEYIYYRTDHHWTTQGAYYAYSELCGALGLEPFDRAAHTAVDVPDFYGTFYSRARTWNAQPDTLTYYDLDNPLTIYTVTGPGMPTEGQTTGLYDLDKLDVYDKYAAFLHGNNGLSRVEGDGEGRILVIKDSYANSFVPFLTANYAQIDVVDLRNYNYGLDGLIAENGYDQILVLYSFDSFKSDPYLYRAGIEG
ncbi:MAG TPA: hypothetical protein H9703_01750 [Candidatus Faecalibacterium faecigallinarum]|uniref:AlgX/AlgJ SGNH hydrolase-like domain-containing protein n=1 Tax=Candidatus Faecalibacterium faecigallinarum TaxID=2838577 RepID=A0A9D2P5T7_9FIRM|nr:hypothetical protein [Candidatus Faecalibacterium faecigallinarum]